MRGNTTVPEQKQSNAASILSVLGALVIWGSSFVAIKFAYTTYPPLTLAAVRFVVATLILGALTLLPKNRVKLEKKDILTVAVCGLTGIMLYAVLQNIAMQWTSASSATLIIASYPIITLLMAIFAIMLAAAVETDYRRSTQNDNGKLVACSTSFSCRASL